MNVHYVKNSTARHKDAEVKYTVRMREISESKQIRDKFGLFFESNSHRKMDSSLHYKIFSLSRLNGVIPIAVEQIRFPFLGSHLTSFWESLILPTKGEISLI